MNELIKQVFTVKYTYDVRFTTDLFAESNPLLAQFFAGQNTTVVPKLLVVIDEGAVSHHKELIHRINDYIREIPHVSLIAELIVVPGGEAAKNNNAIVDRVIGAVDLHRIDRHSYIMAIGGGAVLDAVGYAAAVAHR